MKQKQGDTFSNLFIAALILFRLHDDIFFFSSEGFGAAYAAIKKSFKKQMSNVLVFRANKTQYLKAPTV